jgi:hypothetical protein
MEYQDDDREYIRPLRRPTNLDVSASPSPMATSGWIYCMTNPSMPGLVKIGYTDRPVEHRLEEANAPHTWIPTPFVIECAKYVKDANAREQLLHKLLNVQRVSPRREFFRVDLEHVRLLLGLCDGTEWAPIEEEDEDASVVRVASVSEQNVRAFLDQVIYPTVGGPCVQWADVVQAFQTWKATTGNRLGSTQRVNALLREQYGTPTYGHGWTNFHLRPLPTA